MNAMIWLCSFNVVTEFLSTFLERFLEILKSGTFWFWMLAPNGKCLSRLSLDCPGWFVTVCQLDIMISLGCKYHLKMISLVRNDGNIQYESYIMNHINLNVGFLYVRIYPVYYRFPLWVEKRKGWEEYIRFLFLLLLSDEDKTQSNW